MKSGSGQPSFGASDWYLYDGQDVRGPYSAAYFHKLDVKVQENSYVSKVGFSKWYRYSEVSHLVTQLEELDDQVAAERKELRELIKGFGLPPKPQKPKAPKVRPPQPVGSSRPQAKTARSHAQTEASRNHPQPASRGDLHEVPPNPTPKQKVAESLTEKTLAYSQKITSQRPTSDVPPTQAGFEAALKQKGPAATEGVTFEKSAPIATEPQTLQEAYFFARGRLRLGEMKSPWMTAFFYFPLTLGLSYFVWYPRLSRELNFHLANSYQMGSISTFWAIIPGLYFLQIWGLAKQMEAVEKQNNYHLTSRWVALMFSLLPPLAIYYLQRAATIHWVLHSRRLYEIKCGQGN